MKPKERTMDKINLKECSVAIIGLGYVGIPLALLFAKKYNVIGFDIDENKVNLINDGVSYIEHINSDKIKNAIDNGFKATSDFNNLEFIDVFIICVPTPLNSFNEPDLSYVINTANSISPYLKKGSIISLESTTYPGTTEDVFLPIIKERGFIAGENVFLLFSPEREDPGNQNYTTQTIPKICGGYSTNCLEIGVKLYESVIDKVIPVSSTKAAEMTKLMENIHRAVNIGLVNEMKMICDLMNIDIHEVIEAAGTKPFGFVPYLPGPGIGGHCIPIDPFYLTWKAKEYGFHTRFIELAGEINKSMPSWVIDKVIKGLNTFSKSVKNSKILILGVAYKKNVDDMRESPSLVILNNLEKLGAQLSYSDPHVPKFPNLRKYSFNLNSIEISQERLSSFDIVVLATDHDLFDYDLILKHSKLIVDTRGKYRKEYNNVIKA